MLEEIINQNLGANHDAPTNRPIWRINLDEGVWTEMPIPHQNRDRWLNRSKYARVLKRVR